MAGAVFMNNVFWRREQRIERVIRDRMNPLEEFSEEQCVGIFRFDRNTLLTMLERIDVHLARPSNRGSPLPPALQLCCALRYLATGDMMRTVGNSLGLSKASTSRLLHRVMDAILTTMHQEIHYPEGNEVRQVQEGFFRKFSFPGVVGLIDGTHMRILAPHENEEAYVNRKGYHSINNQVTVDDRSIITSVVSRYA